MSGWISVAEGNGIVQKDTTVQSVGGGKAGLMSPRNMLALYHYR